MLVKSVSVSENGVLEVVSSSFPTDEGIGLSTVTGVVVAVGRGMSVGFDVPVRVPEVSTELLTVVLSVVVRLNDTVDSMNEDVADNVVCEFGITRQLLSSASRTGLRTGPEHELRVQSSADFRNVRHRQAPLICKSA